jgi:hypothetical protein
MVAICSLYSACTYVQYYMKIVFYTNVISLSEEVHKKIPVS